MKKRQNIKFAITLVKMAATGIAGGLALINSAKKIGEMIERNEKEKISEGKSMKTDVQIAQEAKLKPITEIAKGLGISEEELEQYGRYKAKINSTLMDRLKDKPDGKLVLVTAINPTPAGEGKTTTNVGLSMALDRIGRRS